MQERLVGGVCIALLAFCVITPHQVIACERAKSTRVSQNAPPGIEELIEKTRSADAQERGMAAKELGRLGDSSQKVVDALIAMMGDTGCYRDENGDEILMYVLAGQALKRIGNAAVVPCITSCTNSSGFKRRELIYLLGSFKDSRATNALTGILGTESNADLRIVIAGQLSDCEDPVVVPFLLTALTGDKDSRVRERIAADLCRRRDPRVIEPLIASLNDESEKVRFYAAKALGRQRGPKVVPSLLTVLRDRKQSTDSRGSAACALGSSGDPIAVDPLIVLLQDGRADDLLRCNTANGLALLKDKRAIVPLSMVLKDKANSHLLRVAAMRSLVEVQGIKSVALLADIARNGNENRKVRFWASVNIITLKDGAIDDASLVGPLTVGFSEVRDLHETVGRMGDAATEALEKVATHGSTATTRGAAARVIRMSGGQ